MIFDPHSGRPGLIAILLVAMLATGLSVPSEGQVLSAPKGAGTVRALLVGDSWAELIWLNGSLRTVFAGEGRPDLLEQGDVTAISGSTAAEWATSGFLQLITERLLVYDQVDAVQITIGGNDLLDGQSGGGWWAGMPPDDEDALFDRVLTDLATVVDHSLAHDPAIRVIVSLYDYPNFVDTIDVFDPFGCRDRWNDLSQPTPQQINQAMIELQNRAEAMISSRPRAGLVSHLGLMQYLHVGLPPPGDPTLPSPLQAMLFGEDCIHLSPDGYLAVAQNLWNGFYYAHFGGLFTDGFESGDTTAWSGAQP